MSWIFANSQPVVIRRSDIKRVHDYAREKCCLRDYLLVRLPMMIGLRAGEICSLKIENINFKERSFMVVDSKSLREYPLPLDPVSLALFEDLIKERHEGYVFTREVFTRSWSHSHEGRPLHVTTIEKVIDKTALQVGVKGLTPRLLRHYFAANWHYVEKKSIEILRRILRHKSLAYTQFYLARLIFWEDLQKEYEDIKNGPFIVEAEVNVQVEKARALTVQVCADCPNIQVCKYADHMPEWVTGCKFKPVVAVSSKTY